MSDRKTSKRGYISAAIGLLLVGAIEVSGVMLWLSVRDLVVGSNNQQSITDNQLSTAATPTFKLPDTATPLPRPSATPPPSPSASPSGWQTVRPGLETRRFLVLDPADNRLLEQVEAVRLDPSQFRFDVGYSPSGPKTLERWQQESGAILAVNGGYFTAENVATGLVIANGQPSGASYGPFAGMVSIVGDGSARNLDVRWLSQAPYSPAENLWGGFQAFPMLVTNGTAAFPPSSDNGDRARRTVIGKDASGRVVILATTQGWFTLSEISSWLAGSGLELQTAVNLDGGPSTGLILQDDDRPMRVLPFSPLPTVLLVYE